jgi:hypothetical protein
MPEYEREIKTVRIRTETAGTSNNALIANAVTVASAIP